MKLEDIFSIYNIKLIEDGKTRPLSDVLEDLYLLIAPDEFTDIRTLIAIEESENNVFEEFRTEYEDKE
jgi:hypothetical protein